MENAETGSPDHGTATTTATKFGDGKIKTHAGFIRTPSGVLLMISFVSSCVKISALI